MTDRGRLTRELIELDRATITGQRIDELVVKFREQIGGVYEVVAAALVRDHQHLERPGE